MKGKVSILVVVFAVYLIVFSIGAYAYTPPTTFGAPNSFGVSYEAVDNSGAFKGFNATITMPSDLRALIDASEDANSEFNQNQYFNLFVRLQLDYKIDNGNWHYDSSWDAVDKMGDQSFSLMTSVGSGVYTTDVTYYEDDYFEKYFSTELTPPNEAYFDTHTWHFRTRFVVSYTGPQGEEYFTSPWSDTVNYTNAATEYPAKLIAHAPVLKSIAQGKYANDAPYLTVITMKPHTDLDKLSAISSNHLMIQVWIKVDDGEWKLGDESIYKENLTIDASDYLGSVSNFDAAQYQIKTRYAFDYYWYPAAGKTGTIYSPYSNILTHGMDGWSEASGWAVPTLTDAQELGLIPSILNGADMTKPITREEFAELAVLLYEKVTGKTAIAQSPNPFTDTSNPQILKALTLKIASGISPTEFAPNRLLNREQCATMLFNTLKAINPTADYSIAGAKDFPDQKYISSWAVAATKYMAKIGILNGNSKGEFMPKATTAAQEAAGYGMATREQAIALSVNSFRKLNK